MGFLWKNSAGSDAVRRLPDAAWSHRVHGRCPIAIVGGAGDPGCGSLGPAGLRAAHPLKTLNPVLPFNGAAFMLMTQNMASNLVSQMGRSMGTLAPERDQIVRAIDALLSGI